MKLPTTIQATVLRLLSGGKQMYGLELVEASNKKLKRGTVYVTLYRMEEYELIESVDDDAGQGRLRYRITANGLMSLNALDTAQDVMTAGLLQPAG